MLFTKKTTGAIIAHTIFSEDKSMSVIQPQSKLDEVVSYLNLCQGIIKINDFQLASWLRDAKALQKTNPVEGYMMESLVYRAQGKIRLAVQYAEKAFRLDKSIAGSNYLALIKEAGCLDKADELAIELLNLYRTDTSIFDLFVMNSPYTLNIDLLKEGIRLFKPTNKKAQNMVKQAESYLEAFNANLEMLKLTGVSIETFKRVMEVSTRIKSRQHIGTNKLRISYQDNEIGKFLIITQSLKNTSVEDCIRMNDEFVDAIIDDDYPFQEFRKIIFNFMPLDEKPLISHEYEESMV